MHTLAVTYESYVNRFMALCAGVVVISVFAYGFLLLEAVGHTVSRSNAEKNIREISTALGQLEARYLSQTQVVTPSLAVERGFVQPSETTVVFAVRTALSLNGVNAE